MSDTPPMKMLVDCSQQRRPSDEVMGDLRKRVTDLVAEGRLDEARELAGTAIRPMQPAEGVMVPLTKAELDQRELDRISGEELAVQMRRSQRNALLAQSDWVMFPDVNLGEKKHQAWFEYRQALRDLDFSSPDVVWPDAPA